MQGCYSFKPAIKLIVSATTKVFRRKEIRPCIRTTRLILREEISTSDTWKVMPITKAK